MATFIPQYAQPFGMAELEELDTALISQEIQRLQKSIALLESTNAQLLASLDPSSPSSGTESGLVDDDIQVYKETIDENREAIAQQKERIQMCVWVIKKRVGIDPGNRHYELDGDTTAITEVKQRGGEENGQSTSVTLQDTAVMAEARENRTATRQQPASIPIAEPNNDNMEEQEGMYL